MVELTLALVAVVLVVALVMGATQAGRGRSLAKTFASMGDLRGKSLHEIARAAGAPTSHSALADGSLVQWQKNGYHIALVFDESNVCRGVSHEHFSE